MLNSLRIASLTVGFQELENLRHKTHPPHAAYLISYTRLFHNVEFESTEHK